MDITEITEIISGAFAIPEPPLTPLPPPLVALGGVNKTGLSARKIAARIISRQSEAGAPVGARRNGEDNVSEMKIEVALRPGIPVTTTGIGNFGGPVVSQGATTNFATGNGQAR